MKRAKKRASSLGKYLIGIDEAGRATKNSNPRPTRYLIGIDEAGRGPLAGPLVVAGIIVPAKFNQRRELKGIKDSKKLTKKQRDEWYARLIAHKDIRYSVAHISPQIIDHINILQAAYRGAQEVHDNLSTLVQRCTKVKQKGYQDRNKAPSIDQKYRTSIRRRIEVLKRNTEHNMSACHALLDGSLKLKKGASYEVIIRGDEKIPIISAASIIAKVTRDRIMARLHQKYPRYGFDEHKGYGTKKHMKALRKFGPSGVHRKSFLSFLEA